MRGSLSGIGIANMLVKINQGLYISSNHVVSVRTVENEDSEQPQSLTEMRLIDGTIHWFKASADEIANLFIYAQPNKERDV